MKIKITAKFRASGRLRFEDKKRIMSPEKFQDFRETDPCWPELLEAQLALTNVNYYRKKYVSTLLNQW